LRNIPGDGSNKLDYIPVDVVANMVIAAAAERGSRSSEVSSTSHDNVGVLSKRTGGDEVPVYNCTCTNSAPLFLHEVVNFSVEGFKEAPDEGGMIYPSLTIRQSPTLLALLKFTQQWVPMALADLGCVLTGAKPKFLKINRLIDEGERVMSYFWTNEWTWGTERNDKLWNWLSPSDRHTFNFDLSKLDWEKLFSDYVAGIRRFSMKQQPKTIEASRRRLAVLRVIHYALQLVAVSALPALWLLARRLGTPHALANILAKLAPLTSALKVNSLTGKTLQ
jgi:fatty acyl-CoA reductase